MADVPVVCPYCISPDLEWDDYYNCYYCGNCGRFSDHEDD